MANTLPITCNALCNAGPNANPACHPEEFENELAFEVSESTNPDLSKAFVKGKAKAHCCIRVSETSSSLSNRECNRLNKHCLILLASLTRHAYLSCTEIFQRVHTEIYGKDLSRNFNLDLKHQLCNKILFDIAEKGPCDASFPEMPCKFRLNSGRGYEELRKVPIAEINEWPHFASENELSCALRTYALARQVSPGDKRAKELRSRAQSLDGPFGDERKTRDFSQTDLNSSHTCPLPDRTDKEASGPKGGLSEQPSGAPELPGIKRRIPNCSSMKMDQRFLPSNHLVRLGSANSDCPKSNNESKWRFKGNVQRSDTLDNAKSCGESAETPNEEMITNLKSLRFDCGLPVSVSRSKGTLERKIKRSGTREVKDEMMGKSTFDGASQSVSGGKGECSTCAGILQTSSKEKGSSVPVTPKHPRFCESQTTRIAKSGHSFVADDFYLSADESKSESDESTGDHVHTKDSSSALEAANKRRFRSTDDATESGCPTEASKRQCLMDLSRHLPLSYTSPLVQTGEDILTKKSDSSPNENSTTSCAIETKIDDGVALEKKYVSLAEDHPETFSTPDKVAFSPLLDSAIPAPIGCCGQRTPLTSPHSISSFRIPKKPKLSDTQRNELSSGQVNRTESNGQGNGGLPASKSSSDVDAKSEYLSLAPRAKRKRNECTNPSGYASFGQRESETNRPDGKTEQISTMRESVSNSSIPLTLDEQSQDSIEAFSELYDEYSELYDFVESTAKEFNSLADEMKSPLCNRVRKQSIQSAIQLRYRSLVQEHNYESKQRRYKELYHLLKPFCNPPHF